MNKVILIGSSGSLAKQIYKTLSLKNNYLIYNISRKKFNYIRNFKKLKNTIKKFKPNFIINCSAMVGWDSCENNPEMAYEVNSILPAKLAEALIGTNIKLIHFSTETVFDGKKLRKIYSEKDRPNPISIYGKSKYFGEKAINSYKNSLIIRLPLIYGPTHNKQIVGRMLERLRLNKKIYVAKDVFYTPVYSPDVSEYLHIILSKHELFFKRKLIHYTSNNYTSLYNFIKKLAKPMGKIHLIKSVNDSFFGYNNLKPKNLGLKSVYKINNF